jgi:hypothetical protein
VTIINTTTPAAGRRWAYNGIILGGTVSIAANVAHSFIPPHGAPAGWHPQPGAVVGAIVWPVFLFIAIEIMARTTWPTGPQWGLLRWGGLLPVAAVAAFVSYRHLSGLLAFYGEDHLVVILGPLAIDGLMAMATGALIATSPNRTRPTTRAGQLATQLVDEHVDQAVAVATAIEPVTTPTARPAARKTTTKTTGRTPAKKTAKAPAKGAAPAKVPASSESTVARTSTPPADSTVTTNPEPALRPASPARTAVPTAPAPAIAPSTPDIHVATVDAAPPLQTPAPAALLTRAAHIADAHRTATGTPITAGEMAVRMRVNSDTAAQLIALFDLRHDSPTRPIATVNGTPATTGAAR